MFPSFLKLIKTDISFSLNSSIHSSINRENFLKSYWSVRTMLIPYRVKHELLGHTVLILNLLLFSLSLFPWFFAAGQGQASLIKEIQYVVLIKVTYISSHRRILIYCRLCICRIWTFLGNRFFIAEQWMASSTPLLLREHVSHDYER